MPISKAQLKINRELVFDALIQEGPFPAHRRHRMNYLFARIQNIDYELYKREVSESLPDRLPVELRDIIADMSVSPLDVTIQKKMHIR